MRLSSEPDIGPRSIDLNTRPRVDSREIDDELVASFAAERHVVGINIQHASCTPDLRALKPRSLPTTRKMA